MQSIVPMQCSSVDAAWRMDLETIIRRDKQLVCRQKDGSGGGLYCKNLLGR